MGAVNLQGGCPTQASAAIRKAANKCLSQTKLPASALHKFTSRRAQHCWCTLHSGVLEVLKSTGGWVCVCAVAAAQGVRPRRCTKGQDLP